MRASRQGLYLIALLLLAGCGGGGGGGGVEVDLDTAMPQQTGDRWAYMDKSGATRIDRVREQTTVSGRACARVEVNEDGFVWSDYRQVTSNAITFMGYDESGAQYRYQPPQDLPAVVTIGKTYTASGRLLRNGTDQGPCSISITVERVEDVTVAAGTFTNCLVVRVDSEDPWDDWSNRVWYAPGAGVVKLQGISSARDVELTGAHVGVLDFGTPPSP